MFCTKCGVELPEDAVFCNMCGTKVAKDCEKHPKKEEVKNSNLNNIENPIAESLVYSFGGVLSWINAIIMILSGSALEWPMQAIPVIICGIIILPPVKRLAIKKDTFPILSWWIFDIVIAIVVLNIVL